MEIIEVLEQTGLNVKEASIYLALLELGTASVQSISHKAGVKRPTTYLILDDLQRKGLVSEVPQKKALYTAESPNRLIGDLNKKQELVKRFLPDLLAFYNAKKDKPRVQLFQGKEGISQVYDILFSSPEVLFFSTVKEVFEIFPEMPIELRKKIKNKQIRVREIITRREEDLAYAQEMEQGEYYQTRLTPSGMNFLTDSAIFGDNLALFSFHPQIFAVMITSREVSQSLKILFELAWLSAKPLHENKV